MLLEIDKLLFDNLKSTGESCGKLEHIKICSACFSKNISPTNSTERGIQVLCADCGKITTKSRSSDRVSRGLLMTKHILDNKHKIQKPTVTEGCSCEIPAPYVRDTFPRLKFLWCGRCEKMYGMFTSADLCSQTGHVFGGWDVSTHASDGGYTSESISRRCSRCGESQIGVRSDEIKEFKCT